MSERLRRAAQSFSCHLTFQVNKNSLRNPFSVKLQLQSIQMYVSQMVFLKVDLDQAIIPLHVPRPHLHLLNLSSFISACPVRLPVVYHVREKSYLGGL